MLLAPHKISYILIISNFKMIVISTIYVSVSEISSELKIMVFFLFPTSFQKTLLQCPKLFSLKKCWSQMHFSHQIHFIKSITQQSMILITLPGNAEMTSLCQRKFLLQRDHLVIEFCHGRLDSFASKFIWMWFSRVWMILFAIPPVKVCRIACSIILHYVGDRTH